MEFGYEDDPGFVLETEARDVRMSTALPPTVGLGVVDASVLHDMSLAPTLAGSLLEPGYVDGGGLPLSGAKVTRFACGGAALCVAVSHIHFDAGALGTFVTDWVSAHAALARGQVPAVPERPYSPAAYDALAAGDLDANDEDPALVELEETLDVFRYDSWASDGANPLPPGAVVPPPQMDAADAARGRRRGTVPPRHTRSAAKNRIYGLDFTSSEVEKIAAAAKAQTSEKISTQDAFAAHLWRRVARSRGQEEEAEVLDFAMACDARQRFTTLYDMSTPGCWNVCLGMQARGSDLFSPRGLGWAASRIRKAINSTQAPVLAAWLHRRAHDLAPERFNVAFAGNTTVCTTNWARTGLHDADFGGGLPVLVHNLVSGFGGYATITRVPGIVGGRWYEPGVRATLWLEEEAMGRLIADPELRPE
jgi:hypothetical protein